MSDTAWARIENLLFIVCATVFLCWVVSCTKENARLDNAYRMEALKYKEPKP